MLNEDGTRDDEGMMEDEEIVSPATLLQRIHGSGAEGIQVSLVTVNNQFLLHPFMRMYSPPSFLGGDVSNVLLLDANSHKVHSIKNSLTLASAL